MPARDKYHQTVINALIKDGWTITHDPYPLKFGEEDLYVDLAAEAPVGAEKGGRKIAVEVKSFLGRSPMKDLELALGQFVLYWHLVQKKEPDRKLYLALSDITYETVLDTADGRDLIAAMNIPLVLFDTVGETIVEWK